MELTPASQTFYHIEKQSSNYLVLRLDFPDPEITTGSVNPNMAYISLPGLVFNYEEGKPLLPVYSTSLIVPPGKVSWQIIAGEEKFIPSLKPILYFPENTDADIKGVYQNYKPGLFPEKAVSLNEAGIFRDYRMMSLKIYPVQVTPGGVKIYRSLKIKIQFPRNQSSSPGSWTIAEKNVFRKAAINGDQVTVFAPAISVAPASPPASLNQSGSAERVKIYVKKKGIYRITPQDLADAGVDIQSVNPRNFRLTNKGKDVPILISGDQDFSFDPGDYFEFWGERNEKTLIDKYSDVYNDPFTDENVYWLSWGGPPGVRMVEESGAILQTNPDNYNLAYFYPYTAHIETDANFERLGWGNTHRLSYTRDLWFFDSGIQAIGKKSYSAFLIYPDSSSFNPVSVTMKFCGKSISPHTMMVWLNQQLVGQTSGEWFNQDTFTLTNTGNFAIRSADLKHGINNIEVQLPTIHPNYQSDYVLFNWADITYDRQYKAFHNYIEFTRPSPSIIYHPNINLFQFEIYNFTRPDIEVYKKGMSKIVNYSLITEGTGNNRRYKIVFQDHILSDDVEYIALTPDLKLKPVRIEKEEPYDPQNPTLSLKDPANSADYVIITHQKFYDRALDLAEFRRQQGLNVVIVKVQDIYDEFNHGIKSPLAIKKFLKYAFYNWDRNHRLKYVLLLGGANYRYDIHTSGHTDFVPTFFYQSNEFGAVSTDFPYALIAGEDEIPDLFVGRIPVTTAGDVSIILNKIMEYEQTPLIGPWRNQSLFISGKDDNTPEFDNITRMIYQIPARPAFRTQNQRLIDLLLPRHFTSFKLNTIPDTSLAYDPNFGGKTDLIEYFDDGVNFMTFLGHGGGGIWADVNLLDLDDVERLNNQGKYPFIASMTCFTGAFDNPGDPGLAQKLLLASERGAIGLLASSGLGYVANDYAMVWHLMENLFQPDITVGEAVTISKIDYFTTSKYVLGDTIIPGYRWGHYWIKYDMIYQYNLLGDPYISLKIPREEIQIQADNMSPQPGDTVLALITAPFSTAEGYIELSNRKNEVIFREPIIISGGQMEFRVPIPVDFPRGPAFLRAYLSDNSSDATGVIQLGVNYTVFDSVHTVPLQPNAEDSVEIQMVLKENAGISGVSVVAVIPKSSSQQDTFHLRVENVSGNTFRTIEKIPPTYSLTTVYYFIYVTNSQGQISRMGYNYRVIETRPDPLLYEGRIRLSGEQKVKLGISVGNSGTVPATGVELRVYNGRQNYLDDQPFVVQQVNIPGKDSLTVDTEFPFPLNVPEYKIYAVLDRNALLPDFNRQNNIDSVTLNVNRFNILPELGSTYDNATSDTILIGGSHRFWVAPGGINQSTAALWNVETFPQSFYQTGLKPVPLAGGNDARFVQIKLLNGDANFTSPAVLEINYNKAYMDTSLADISDLRLYRRDNRIQAWMQQDAQIDTAAGTITTYLNKDGYFAPFITGDNQPPRIELTVDGRHIRSKSLVSPNPVLNVVLEDESGLNIDRSEIQILIDQVPVPPEKIFIPDSVQHSKILGFTVYPELETGKHDLSIRVKDVNGNLANQEYTLKVDTDFDLHVFGNYPNPFSDFTIFSYYITSTEILDDFEIRIFTVSGRLIRVIKRDENTSTPENDPRRAGYNELMWDGTDEDGNEVANGVYFALIRAKFEGKEKEKILKVAKLK